MKDHIYVYTYIYIYIYICVYTYICIYRGLYWVPQFLFSEMTMLGYGSGSLCFFWGRVEHVEHVEILYRPHIRCLPGSVGFGRVECRMGMTWADTKVRVSTQPPV